MNMKCANKDCTAELKYLRGGHLFFMERQSSLPGLATPLYSASCAKASECSSFEPPSVATKARAKPTVTMRRYFWLCEHCAQVYTIRRWTENGIELTARSKPVHVATAVSPLDWNLPGLVG